MSRSIMRGLLPAMVAVSLSGCALFLVGAGAAGGYAMSKDSIKNYFDLSQGRVYRAARDVVAELGAITSEDARHGVLKGVVQGANVTVTVKPVSRTTVELHVKARDSLLLPKLDAAQTVYNKIFSRLQ